MPNQYNDTSQFFLNFYFNEGYFYLYAENYFYLEFHSLTFTFQYKKCISVHCAFKINVMHSYSFQTLIIFNPRYLPTRITVPKIYICFRITTFFFPPPLLYRTLIIYDEREKCLNR